MQDLFLVILYIILIASFYIIKMHKINNYLRSKEKKKNLNVVEINYMKYRFNIEPSSLFNAKFILLFSVINASIIEIVFFVIMHIKLPIILLLLISFVLLIGLIYSIYEILGRILIKKGNK